MNHRERAKKLVSQMTLTEKLQQMRYKAPPIERLNIPAYNWWNESLHGVGGSGSATMFPQSIAMAASFNTEKIKEVAVAISDEGRAKYNEYKKIGSAEISQGITYYAPNINIFRDPRWGRGHETYGEDPYLTGAMACAYVEGLQGDNGEYRKADATLKHYAVHSGPEIGRHGFDAIVDERDLEETYLWAFKYCIDHAKPAAVMGAYNRINGEPCCGSKTYLKDKLLGEWGFDGYVVSDCGAIGDFDEHHKVTWNKAESAALAVNNGCHLNCGTAYRWLSEAIRYGLIEEEVITVAVEKLFETRYRLGMFDEECEYNHIPYDMVECEKHRRLNREMAGESIVLLKNNGILPLKKDMKIALIGPNADDKDVLYGSYQGRPSYYTTFLKGLQERAEGKLLYARGCHLFLDSVNFYDEKGIPEAVIAANKSDVVVMCMGLHPCMEGEEGDPFNGIPSGDKQDLELPAVQLKLLQEIAATGKPIIFLNISGSCVNLTLPDQLCDAVLQVFYPGAEGGKAIADILFGEVCPSGKLPVTFYKSAEQLPDFTDYSMKNRTYRYFKGEALYTFGYGLSYTEFEVTNIAYLQEKAKCTVKNAGMYDGSIVVKVYVKSEGYKELNRQLAGFHKTFLKQGETRMVEISLCKEILDQIRRYGETEYELEW